MLRRFDQSLILLGFHFAGLLALKVPIQLHLEQMVPEARGSWPTTTGHFTGGFTISEYKTMHVKLSFYRSLTTLGIDILGQHFYTGIRRYEAYRQYRHGTLLSF